jgi:hypothetical protein
MFWGSTRAGILAAFLLCAAGALGQSGVTNSYDINVNNQVAVNSCSAGEPVALTGVVHLSYTVSTDSTGVNHFIINANSDLTGAGQNTGLAYAGSESAEYDSNNDDASADLTVELKSDLKPQGTGVALSLVQALHVTVDTGGSIGAQVVGSTTSCGS